MLNYTTTDPDGGAAGRASYFYEDIEVAKAQCEAQNAKAESMGLKTRYYLGMVDDEYPERAGVTKEVRRSS